MRMEARRAETCSRQGLVYDSRPLRGMPQQQSTLDEECVSEQGQSDEEGVHLQQRRL